MPAEYARFPRGWRGRERVPAGGVRFARIHGVDWTLDWTLGGLGYEGAMRGRILQYAGRRGDLCRRASFWLALVFFGVSSLVGFVRAVRLFGVPPIETDATILGRAFVGRGAYAQAVEEFRLAGLIDPERYDPPPELAFSLSGGGETGALLGRSRSRVQQHPRDAGAYLALGRALLQRGEITKSVRSLERARALDPELRGLHRWLGQAYLTAGMSRQAEDAFREGLGLAPERADLHEGLGMALYGLGRLEEAVRAFERAQELRARARARSGAAGS
jgi:tetratricopeptide (TPR) repeat protein